MSATIVDRIAANPNPRRLGRLSRFIAWGRNLDREAAIDSTRNVLAFIGAGAVMAYIGTMPLWLTPVAAAVFGGTWYLDYLRHF